MYCPSCRKEYGDFILDCPDCHLRLTETLPPITEDDEPIEADDQIQDGNDEEFVELLTTSNQGDIAVVKSILDGTDIFYTIENEFGNMLNWGFQPARFLVRKDQRDAAAELLQDIEPKFFRLSTEHSGDEETDNEKEV